MTSFSTCYTTFPLTKRYATRKCTRNRSLTATPQPSSMTTVLQWVQFYPQGDQSGHSRICKTVNDTIYGDGPGATMFGAESPMDQKGSEIKHGDSERTIEQRKTYAGKGRQFTWIHPPTNNVSSMLPCISHSMRRL